MLNKEDNVNVNNNVITYEDYAKINKEDTPLKDIFNEISFETANIKKEMEIENIYLTEENIQNMEKIYNGFVTVDELVQNTIEKFGE